MKLLTAALLLLSASLVMAATPDDVKKRLLEARPDLPIASVGKSVMPGFWEVTLAEGTTLFVDDTATHFIAGDLYRIEAGGFVNVSDEKRNGLRRELLASLDPDDMVVFAPPKGRKKATITVFTDIDCGYCRKLHQEVPELNRLGVEVRYLAYPRAGLESASYDKYVSAWCADNRQLAMTKAKMGQVINNADCDNPVAAQYELGSMMGVTGTPAVVFDNGRLQPGYIPAAEMAARLGIN